MASLPGISVPPPSRDPASRDSGDAGRSRVQALFVTAGSWYLPKTAAAFLKRGALAALWMSDRNKGRFPASKFGWCWPLFWVTKPLHFTPLKGYWAEWIFWRALPAWLLWMRFRRYPAHNVVQARMGYAVEPFARAERTGALKVLDCANSHPATQAGLWQREIDRFAPGLEPILPTSLFRRMEREVGAADLLLCPSDFVRDTMVAHGVPEEKCFVCPFGYDPELFAPREKVPAVPRFLFTGTVGLRKGVPYLLRAFARVREALPDAELLLIGDVHYDIARELPRWRGLYTHLPGVPQAVLAAELRRSTAYVFPSCEEGFARSVIEAMGCGVPVVASHESGATTFLRRAEGGAAGGIVVDPRDVDGIAAAMLRLARDRELNRAMGETARRLVEGWTWQAYGDAVLARYDAVLGARKEGA